MIKLQPLWMKLVTGIGSRVLCFFIAWGVIAVVGFIPWGFEHKWQLWTEFDFSGYLTNLTAYASRVLQLDLGTTHSGQSVAHALLRVTPRSLMLMGTGMAWALIVGLAAGTLAVSSRRRGPRNALMATTFAALSVPDFFIIVIVQTVILHVFRTTATTMLPALGSVTLAGMILPAFAIGILPAAYFTRTVAIAVEELEDEDFVRTAIGKGLSRAQTFLYHVLRNVIGTTLSILPSVYAMMVSSLVLVEYLYVYPGLGHLLLTSFRRPGIGQPSSEMLVGAGMMLAGLYFLLDIVVTAFRTWADPRLRGEAGN